MPLVPDLGRFSAFLVGTVFLTLNCTFFLPTPRSIAELQSYVGVFENSSNRPRSIYIFAGFGDTTGPKLGGKIPKRGQKFGPQNILTLFLDLKFHVDFDFSINHDLIP